MVVMTRVVKLLLIVIVIVIVIVWSNLIGNSNYNSNKCPHLPVIYYYFPYYFSITPQNFQLSFIMIVSVVMCLW